VPDSRRHPAHLAVAPLLQNDLQPAVRHTLAKADGRVAWPEGGRGHQPGTRAAGVALAQFNPSPQGLQRLFIWRALDLGPVGLPGAVARVAEPGLQGAVVGQHDQPLAVMVKPASRVHARHRDIVRQRRLPAAAAELAQHPEGLVEKQQSGPGGALIWHHVGFIPAAPHRCVAVLATRIGALHTLGILGALLGTLLGAIVLQAGHARAADEVPAAFSDAELHRHIAVLASDEFGGRFPGSEGEALTLDYLVQEFTAAGAKPGKGDSFLQAVPLVSWTLEQAPVLRFSGDGRQLALEYRSEMVAATRREESLVRVEDSPLVFAGYGIVAPEYGWNDYEGIDVRGKTVVVLVNDPGFATEDPALFTGRAMTYYGRWTYKFEEAARQGAAAAIIVHETEPASYGWAVIGEGPDERFGLRGGDNSGPMLDVQGWMTRESAERVFAAAGENFEVLKAVALERGFQARRLGDLKADLEVRSALEALDSFNVVAQVPGNTRPDEYVIFTAHWDHLGRVEEEIFNGAVDNASGTAGLLMLAEAFAKLDPPPERSVLFMPVTAEEQGLLGSAWYAANPVMPLEQTVAVINIDVLNFIGPTRDITVVGYGASELDAFVDAAAAAQGRKVLPDQRPEAGVYYRSDHFSFARQGVPALYPNMGRDLVEGGRERGLELARDYYVNRYHKASDAYSPEQDWRGAARDLELVFDVALRLANSDAWPNWIEGNEFRALRDAQRPEPGNVEN
jgi:Zn-dependent M28 family amino/carboxypeptidase